MNTSSNMLINSIKTIELSELVDCRNILLKFATGEEDNPLSYVELRSLKSSVTVEIPQEEGSEDEPEEGEGVGETDDYTQTAAFEMKIQLDGEPSGITNQVFTDYENMSFTFMFKHSDNEYFVDCGNVKVLNGDMVKKTNNGCVECPEGAQDCIPRYECEGFMRLLLTIKCPKEMGLLCTDRGDAKRWECNLISKTSSGFTYRTDFKLSINAQDLPSEDTPQVSETDERKLIITNGEITG